MVDEVRQIEGKVIEISKLQELFSQNVLQQVKCYDRYMSPTAAFIHRTLIQWQLYMLSSHTRIEIACSKFSCVQAEQIDSISSLTVDAAENVIEGNEQIKGVSSIAR